MAAVLDPKPAMPKARASSAEWTAFERAYAEWRLRQNGRLLAFLPGGQECVEFTDVDAYLAFSPEDVIADEPQHERAEPDMSPEAREARAIAKAREAEARAYCESYTGTFGLILDIQARLRRDGARYTRLSEKQVAAILNSKARDAKRAEDLAGSLEAARINTEIANADEYLAWFARQAAAGTPVTVVAPVAKPVTDGMYRMPDGTVAKVQIAKNGSGNLYAKRLVVEDRGFVYEPGLIRRLTADMRMTLEEAAEFGRLYGVCCVCGRDLTDERSIEAGIGPVCAGRGEWAS